MFKTPDYLGEEGKRFFRKHAKRLERNGMLTEADTESFALLCLTWERMIGASKSDDSKANVNFNSLSKQYFALSKQFGLMPKDRLKSGLETNEEAKDEYGI